QARQPGGRVVDDELAGGVLADPPLALAADVAAVVRPAAGRRDAEELGVRLDQAAGREIEVAPDVAVGIDGETADAGIRIDDLEIAQSRPDRADLPFMPGSDGAEIGVAGAGREDADAVAGIDRERTRERAADERQERPALDARPGRPDRSRLAL